MSALTKLLAFLADDNNRIEPNHQFTDGRIFKWPFKRIVCTDGFELSVQASDHHYCEPQTNDGPWDTVEVWLCGDVPLFNASADYPTRGEEPYARVPIEIVAIVIRQHGGFKE